MMIQPGTYQLSRDVVNPYKPSGREKHMGWRFQEKFKKGDTFHVLESGEGDDKMMSVTQSSGGGYLFEYEPSFAVLVLYLEPVKDKPSYFLARTGKEHLAVQILDHIVSVADVVLAIQEIEGDPDL